METTQEQVQEATPQKLYHQFSSTIKSCRMVMPDGRGISFVNGVYTTDREDEIVFLKTEIKNRHPHISEGAQLTAEDLDPMAALKRKIIEDYEREKALGRDMGSTTKGPLMASAASSAKAVTTPEQAATAATATLKKVDLSHLKKS